MTRLMKFTKMTAWFITVRGFMNSANKIVDLFCQVDFSDLMLSWSDKESQADLLRHVKMDRLPMSIFSVSRSHLDETVLNCRVS